jgi:parallel beta-helix repeat protein
MMRRALTVIVVLVFLIQLCGLASTSDNNPRIMATNVSGIINTDTTWDILGSPYIVVGNVTVPNGITLTIDPGVEVRFDGYYGLFVNGTLFAIGSDSNRIVITSNKSSPAEKDWNSIQIDTLGHAEIRYSDISYGNRSIFLWESSNNIIENNDISNNAVGITPGHSSNNSIAYNNLSYNTFGILLQSSSNNHIHNNNVHSSVYDGILLLESSGNAITDNDLWNNEDGIEFLWISSNNTVEKNDIWNNEHGVNLLVGPSNNTVFNNSILNNDIGIGIYAYANNNTIVDNNITTSIEYGLYQWDSSGSLITGNDVFGSGLSGIYLSESSNNTIVSNNASFNIDTGICLFKSSNNTIKHNTADSNSWNGIRLDPGSNNNIVLNNTASNNLLYQGIGMWSSNNSLIKNNTLISNGQSGLYMYDGTGNIIDGNNASNNQVYDGISIEESDYNHISNNTAMYNNLQGIWMSLSSHNTVHNNTLTYNGNNGIYLNLALHNRITNNNASRNTNFHGISIDNAHSNLIEKNSLKMNNLNGIYLMGMDNIARENEIWNNSQNGIFVEGSNNFVVRNVLSSNTYGLGLTSGTGNRVAYNNITSNLDIGLYSSLSASFNLIHSNNFIANAILHAYDETTDFWNDTCGGNYWDDWTGPDADMNGIVDVPRDISGGSNKDYLPLTTPAIYRRPSPPTNISVKLEGAALEHVNVTWNLSADEGLCYDRVGNYAVYYSSAYDGEGQGYQFLAEVPKGSNHYVHPNAGNGDTNSYFYTVQVNDTSTYEGRNETQVAKFNRELGAGKHLISMPLILENGNIGSVLQTVDFGVAWYYNNSDPLDPWKSYNELKPLNDLTTVNRTMALWLDVLTDSSFTIAGVVPDSTNISLTKGWNFVGYPSFVERNVSEALGAIVPERVEGYSQIPPQFVRIYNDSDLMRPGLGYWVKAGSDDVWVLRN